MVSQIETHLVSWLTTRGDQPDEAPSQPLGLILCDPDGTSPGELLLESHGTESLGTLDSQLPILWAALGESFGLSNG